MICEDKNGEPINPGDIVIDILGKEHEINDGKYRDQYGFGYVYGYYIPDGCTLKPKGL